MMTPAPRVELADTLKYQRKVGRPMSPQAFCVAFGRWIECRHSDASALADLIELYRLSRVGMKEEG